MGLIKGPGRRDRPQRHRALSEPLAAHAYWAHELKAGLQEGQGTGLVKAEEGVKPRKVT
jgi:hypothetical protein